MHTLAVYYTLFIEVMDDCKLAITFPLNLCPVFAYLSASTERAKSREHSTAK